MNRLSLVLVFLLAFIAIPLWVSAQQGSGQGATAAAPDSGHSQHQQGGTAQGHHGKMMGACKAFQEKHDQFTADMKAMDARLDEKIAAMNSAKGDQKVAAMAAVISEMAAQRKEMFDKFGAMHRDRMACMKEGGMQGKMGGHGMMGGMTGGGGGMCPGCPMMQQHHGGMQQQGDGGQGGADKTTQESKG